MGQALHPVLPAAHGPRLITLGPAKPVESALIESFNGRLRDDCLSVHYFTPSDGANAKLEPWRVDQRRPHSSLGA